MGGPLGGTNVSSYNERSAVGLVEIKAIAAAGCMMCQ